jgi:hypothetical protein
MVQILVGMAIATVPRVIMATSHVRVSIIVRRRA